MLHPLLLSLAFLLLALPADAQPSSPARAHEPVVLEGHQIPALLGTGVDRIVGYRLEQAGWVRIPVQVDERDTLDVALAYRHGDYQPLGGCDARCQQIFGSIGRMPYWTDPDTWLGPDSVPGFDVDDELAFMARDAGDRRTLTTADPPGVAAGSRVEVELTAPEGGAPTYAYLFAATAPVGQPAPYVAYAPVFCNKLMRTPSDDCDPIPASVPYREHYDVNGRGAGPAHTYVGYLLGANPEDTWFEGDTYRLHFSDRWILDSLALGADGPDLIDRMKLNGYDRCGRHERTASLGQGAFIVNRKGPVRALRAVIGFNSSPLTQRHYVLYDRYFEQHTFFRGHPIDTDPGKIDYLDYSEHAQGMYYFSNLNEEGAVIDGTQDPYPGGSLAWEAVRGSDPSAAGTILTLFEPFMEAVHCAGPCATVTSTGYFEDGGIPPGGTATLQCTGDPVPLGAGGFRFLPPLPNADPRPLIVSAHGELHHIELRRRTVLHASNLSDQALATLRDRLAHPLSVTVDPATTSAEQGAPVRATQLLPPHPNPTDGRAIAAFTLAEQGPVRLALFDVLGREVLVLDDGPRSGGPHQVEIAAASLPAGRYLLRLTTARELRTQLLTLTGARRP